MVLSYSAGAGLQAMRLRDTTNVGLYDGLMWNECQHSVCCIQHTVMRRQQRLVTVGELRSREASFEGTMGSQMNGMAWGRLHADANAAKREVCVLACGHSSSHATIRLTLIAIDRRSRDVLQVGFSSPRDLAHRSLNPRAPCATIRATPAHREWRLGRSGATTAADIGQYANRCCGEHPPARQAVRRQRALAQPP